MIQIDNKFEVGDVVVVTREDQFNGQVYTIEGIYINSRMEGKIEPYYSVVYAKFMGESYIDSNGKRYYKRERVFFNQDDLKLVCPKGERHDLL